MQNPELLPRFGARILTGDERWPNYPCGNRPGPAIQLSGVPKVPSGLETPSGASGAGFRVGRWGCRNLNISARGRAGLLALHKPPPQGRVRHSTGDRAGRFIQSASGVPIGPALGAHKMRFHVSLGTGQEVRFGPWSTTCLEKRRCAWLIDRGADARSHVSSERK